MSLSLVTTLSLSLVAGQLSVEQTANISRENDKAQAEVSKKYGNRKLTEMSPDERRSMMRDQAAAERKVLDQNGVSAAEWAKASEKVGRGDLAKRQELKQALIEKEKAEAEAKAKAAAGEKDIEVQRGISEENPVTLDEKKNEDGTVTVEKSIPTDAANDMREAEGGDGPQVGTGGDDAPEAKPSKPSKSKGGRRR